MSFQQVFILGNVGKEPEVRHLDGGKVAASLSIATSETYKDSNGNRQEKTEWHNVVAWGNLANFIEKHVKKGASLFLVGKIRTRSYESNGQKKYVTEIVAESIQFAGSKPADKPSENKNNDYPF